MGLTARQVDNAKPQGKPYKLTDSAGLCLLVSRSVRNSGVGATASMARKR